MWRFWIDQGGTFTDVIGVSPEKVLCVTKVLSESGNASAIAKGIAQILASQGSDAKASIAEVRIGTTAGTNALLERSGTPVTVLSTAGFGDTLLIGNQSRDELFARHVRKRVPLFEQSIEVIERISAKGEVLVPLDSSELERIFRLFNESERLKKTPVAIALLHSCINPAHEKLLYDTCKRAGCQSVYLSCETGVPKYLLRTETTVVDAYLGPVLESLKRSLSQEIGEDQKVLFMKSDGGLVPASSIQGRDCLLSGPVGGVCGAQRICAAIGFDKVISFDMGGTSTDVASIQGTPQYQLETKVGGVTISRSAVAVQTVAAGGGSLVGYDGLRLWVGPKSAGAVPGPACYGRGGPLTLTDCNMVLGRLRAETMGARFGIEGKDPLRLGASQSLFKELRARIEATLRAEGTDTELPTWVFSIEGVAERFVHIANDQMAAAVKKVTCEKGFDVREFVLCVYGGAAGQHCCAIAESLGVERIVLHPLASTLSALGIGLADILDSEKVPLLSGSVELTEETLTSQAVPLIAKSLLRQLGRQEGASLRLQVCSVDIHLAYDRTETTLMLELFACPCEAIVGKDLVSTAHLIKTLSVRRKAEELRKLFLTQHRQEFGFCLEESQKINVLSLEIKVGYLSTFDTSDYAIELLGASLETALPSTCQIYFNGQWCDTAKLVHLDTFEGREVEGPAVLVNAISTYVIAPGWTAALEPRGHRTIILTKQKAATSTKLISDRLVVPSKSHFADPFLLELFNNYFKAVAEQMGVVLQRTSQSINIRERLDFSCAVFDQSGSLIANAPHIPIHLGSMGCAVRELIQSQRNHFKEGDVFISNNPFRGGTHLPDITVIAPVFTNKNHFGFVAARGHHADIGGCTPGSMPATSKTLEEEGAVFNDLKIVDGALGLLNENAIRAQLAEGRFPARQPDLNVADIKAQVAAVKRGIEELTRGVAVFGENLLRIYQNFILESGKKAVESIITKFVPAEGREFICPLDEGRQIKLRLTKNAIPRLKIDFTGTSKTDCLNFNAPPAIIQATVLYVLRTLIDDEYMPMNEGCLAPIDLVLPEDSCVNPITGAAVAAGNVEISQNVADALYGCLRNLAGSQGTMNNVTFGTKDFQFYETICGGTGAGASFPGCDAVQSHMTNTQITDVEVVESRFPILVLCFAIRRGSGGEGKMRGGCGAVRALAFLADDVECSVLSSRREVAPFGLEGGSSGLPGRNSVVRGVLKEATSTIKTFQTSKLKRGFLDFSLTETPLAGRGSCSLNKGDVLIIQTPGGGAFGA